MSLVYILESKQFQYLVRLLTPGNHGGRESLQKPSFQMTLLLAILYFTAAYSSLNLIIPQGYASTIWPPSGVALAFLIIYGVKHWPGIVLGYFLAVFSTYLNSLDLTGLMLNTLKTLIISTGPTLQAIVGAKLINHWINVNEGLIETRQILLFFLLGGPLACTISCTIGVTMLVLVGDLSLSEYRFSWVTWWIGDTIGVLLITPLLLVWLGKPAAIWRQRRLRVALPLIVTLGMMSVLFAINTEQDQQRIQTKFTKQSNEIIDLIETQLKNDLAAIGSVQKMLEIFAEVTEAEFRHYVAPLLNQHSAIQSVSLARFNEHEESRISIIHNVTNKAWEESYLSQQMVNTTDYLTAAQRALKSGKPIGLPSYRSERADPDNGNHPSDIPFILPVVPVVPVKQQTDTPTQHLLIAILHADHLHRKITDELQIGNLWVTLTDDSADRQILANWQFDQQGKSTDMAMMNPVTSNALYSEHPFYYGQRAWRLMINATHDYMPAQRSRGPWYILLIGYLFSASLGILLLILTGNTVINQRLAQTDLLTGLYNRRFIEQAAQNLERANKHYTVLLLDLDHFKAINDNWGHQAGDHVLEAAAQKMQELLPEGAYAGRWGGEEFIMLIPETAPHRVLARAEAFRRAISQLNLEPVGQITVSIGCAFQRPGLSYPELLREADQALYRAKENGRNRIEANNSMALIDPANPA